MYAYMHVYICALNHYAACIYQCVYIYICTHTTEKLNTYADTFRSIFIYLFKEQLFFLSELLRASLKRGPLWAKVNLISYHEGIVEATPGFQRVRCWARTELRCRRWEPGLISCKQGTPTFIYVSAFQPPSPPAMVMGQP